MRRGGAKKKADPARDRPWENTPGNRYSLAPNAGILFFLFCLRGFKPTGRAGVTAGVGAAPEMTGAAGAGVGVAAGVAGRAVTGVRDSVLMLISILTISLFKRRAHEWARREPYATP
jgi:hypothetical protein